MKKILYFMAMALAVLMTACDDDFAYAPVVLGDIQGDGTKESPYNIAAAIRQAARNGETSDQFVFVEGYVVSGTIDTSYGNATWDLYDDPDGIGSKFIAYRIKGFNNQKFTDEAQVKVGDKVVIYAPIINYKGNTPETSTGGYLYSINGVVGSDIPDVDPSEPAAEPAGEGTLDSPYNIAKAIEVAKANGEESTVSYYVEGYVASGSIDTSYGNATWDLTDNANGSGSKFIAYRVKDFDNQKFTDANKVKVGDKVVIYAPLINYKGNTPETSGGYLISINGKGESGGSGDEPETPDTPDTPSDAFYTGLVNNMDDWTIDNVKMEDGLEYVWTWKEYNGTYYLNGSAYMSGAKEAESYAYTSLDLSSVTAASFSFDQAAKFQTTLLTECGAVVREAGTSEWTMLTIPTWPEAGSWTWSNSGEISLNDYAGKKIEVGFKYGSTTAGADTWEIKNFVVIATK